MSRLGKICLFLSGLSVVIMVSVRYLLDGWQNFLFVPLGIFVVGFLAAIVIDIRFYLEFLSMRTTKHGMNMGAMILMAIALLVSVNYLGVRFNKTFDFSEEKSNSLAPQTLDLLKSLKGDVKVTILYKGEEAREEKNRVRQALELYVENAPNLKVNYYNSFVENFKAQEYLGDQADKERGQIFVFVEYGGKKMRIEAPYSEEQITQGIIKCTRSVAKTIFFLQGHGERDLDSTEAEGLENLKKALEADSFKVEKLNLLEKATLPESTDVIAVVGPVSALLAPEIEILRKYAVKGGRILMALDPGQKHNLGVLSHAIGVEFKNNYIFNDFVNRLVGKGMASALGLKFDAGSDITKRFKSGQNYTSFDLASEVLPSSEASQMGLKSTELVKTDASSFVLNELKQPKGDVQRRPVTVGVQVQGRLKVDGATDEKDVKQDFEAVVFGDSDFLTNRGIGEGLNRDLALNAFAFLADQGDLVSIRAAQPKGTKLTMTNRTQFGILVAGVVLPILLLIGSAVIWFRRRGA